MSITASELTPADIRACTCGNDGYNNGGMFGNDWAWIIILLLFGWGGRGYGFGGNGGGQGGYAYPCCGTPATQADLAAGFNNSAVLSSLNDLKLGQSQGFNGINTAILQTANGIDNAICTLGYQNQAGVNALSAQLAQCCCDTKGAIKDVNTGIERAGWNLSKQISDCCCDVEKMNLQNRFDAQAFNANTLQAIDRVGDRIIDYMSNEKVQALRDENQALRLAASQSAQNAFITANQEAQTAELIRRLGRDCPVPAYVVPNPNCCYQYNVTPANNCGCGCGSF